MAGSLSCWRHLHGICSRSPDGLLPWWRSANRGASDDPALTHPTTGIPACCAAVPSGHALSSNGASSSRCSGPAEKRNYSTGTARPAPSVPP